MVLHHWDTGQFYVLLINCISCCPIIAVSVYTRDSVKRVTNEEHKGQTLPFSTWYFKFSAALFLALMQMEEEWPVVQTFMLIPNSVSDSSAFEKIILIYDTFFTLSIAVGYLLCCGLWISPINCLCFVAVWKQGTIPF